MKLAIGTISLLLMICIILMLTSYSRMDKMEQELSSLKEQISALNLSAERLVSQTDNTIATSKDSVAAVISTNIEENEDPLGRSKSLIAKQIKMNKANLKDYLTTLQELETEIANALKQSTLQVEQ